MLQTFLTALLGGIVALAGNAAMHLMQNRSKIREEYRSWVRSLHSETVDVVADMDLFNRSIRAAAVAGADTPKERDEVRATIDEKWEGDLLKRVRRLRFGHPDPDVRAAAEEVEDAAWPYMTAARHAYKETIGPFRYREDHRQKAVDGMATAMVEFRRAAYAAPTRKLTKRGQYTGEDLPSYLARAMAEDMRKREQGEGAA